MADLDQLLREFIARFEAGERVRPAEILARVEGTDRRELAALIDGYLERAPRRRYDPADFVAASPAKALVDDLAQAIEGEAGTWPVLLPRLRNAARLKRSELVERLADALGVGAERERVGVYYHRMEQGRLDPGGVSDRVLDALAQLTGTTRQALRSAAQALEGPAMGAAEAGPAFARTAAPERVYLEAMDAAAPEGPGPEERSAADEVDRLFTGGVR